MYPWQRSFYDSSNKIVTLVASNQSGKSAIQMRKAMNWATDTKLWKKLWKKPPIQFWYLYPDGSTATREFEEKWVREFLPSGAMKNHPVYGWHSKKRQGDIDYIRFNSGVTIYFKTYSQNVHNLQAGSCHAIFCDEELPWELLPELQMRIAAYDGYMNFAFTATRGQDEWRRIVEERGREEMWKQGEVDILKLQVTAYDCLFYEDGSPSTVWTMEKIEETKSFLHTQAQIDRRLYGRFVKDESLAYPCFDRRVHLIDQVELDLDAGHVYAGVDYGSGTNHQSAIALVWVNKAHTYGVIFDVWVGEKGIETDAGTVVGIYKEMIAKWSCKVTQVFYDWACADLKIIANGSGLFFEPADKNHASGQRILNTLFKQNMLKLFKGDHSHEAARQLETLTIEDFTPAKKKYAQDDIADCIRYALTKIPWEYVDLRDKPTPLPVASPDKRRRFQASTKTQPEETYIEEEIDEWNEYINDFGFEDFEGFI